MNKNKRINKIYQNQKGISLIEVILYIGLFSIFLASVFSISFAFTDGQAASQRRAESILETIVLVESIRNEIKLGGKIDSPPIGSTSTDLVLNIKGDPFEYKLAGNKWKLPSGSMLEDALTDVVFLRSKDGSLSMTASSKYSMNDEIFFFIPPSQPF